MGALALAGLALVLTACVGSITDGSPVAGDDGGAGGGAATCSLTPPADLPAVGHDALVIADQPPSRMPHWGSRAHGDDTCSGADPSYSSTKFADWTIYRWAGCHEPVYYKIEASVPAAWHAAIDAAFAAWDVPTLCSPHWQSIEGAPAGSKARVHIEVDGHYCGSDGVWFACVARTRAVSEADQEWWMNLNKVAHPMAVGKAGAFDVESLVTVELAHVHYIAHVPGFADSVSTLNNCTWGRTTCAVSGADSCGWSSSKAYTAHCANCGDRRTLGPGDRAVLQHLYGADPDGCASPGETDLACTGCCGADGCGYETRRCGADHRLADPVCVTTTSPP